MDADRLQLVGLDRARYFLPTAICGYLAGLCIVLVITSAFVATLQNAVAVTAAGLFGLLLTGGLGAVFWRAQRQDLRYLKIETDNGPERNYAEVLVAAQASGWRISLAVPSLRLDAQTTSSLLDVGERVAVRFHGNEVWVASICDPSVGFSLVGRRYCAAHRDVVRRAVAGR